MSVTVENIQERVASVAEIDAIGPDDDVYEAGLTSMSAMDLMLSLESDYNIVLDNAFLEARSCRSIAEVVNKAAPA